MRVLMAADGSKHGTAALISACEILAPRGREVELVCVVPRVDGKKPGLQERLEHRAERIAARVLGVLAEAGAPAKVVVRTGSAAKVLLKMCPEYDIAVVGAKSHAGATSPGLGPVASRLTEHANTSVLVARGGAGDGPLRVLAPVDGSDGSLHALDQLRKLVDLESAEVTLMNVVETHWLRPVDDPDWASGEDEEPGGESREDLERDFIDDAGGLLEAARDRLPARASVNTVVYHGIPVDQILSEANTGDYDLLVLAATGEMDVKHRILGSVSGKVTWNAPCSVLLVHTGD